jgi:long-chain fatty acid transport protein
VARGGAVIADVNDWSAIYWNPAGLVNAPSKEAGLELRAGKMYTKDGNSFNLPGVSPSPFDKTRATSGFVIGSMGAVIPLNDKSALAAGIYTPLLQGADFKDANPASFVATSLDYKSNVITGVANVSYSRKLTDKLSGGLGVDVVGASLASDSSIAWGLAVPGIGGMTQKNKSDATGVGVEGVAGVTYRINDRWKAGAVVRSGAKIVLHGEEKVYLNGALQEKSDFTYPVYHPATSGVGLAWQARQDLSVTCDIAQAWWRGFSSALTYDTAGAFLKDRTNSYHWFNSVKFRLGAVKKLNDKYEVMGGYAFDTWAIDRRSVDFSTAIDVPMHRFSGAVTRKWAAVDATLGGLAGSGRRTSSGVDYSLKGWYVMGEVKYKF